MKLLKWFPVRLAKGLLAVANFYFAAHAAAGASLVKNPSFEDNALPVFPGYGAISNWFGGSGVNNSTQPFADNGGIPDRNQIGFMQGPATLSQMITGLTPGRSYWLQFSYNSRNCCTATPLNLTVNFGGAVLAAINGINSGAYHTRSIAFTPTNSAGLLEFVSTLPNGGDRTLLLDGVNIVARGTNEIVLLNPSFEATGAPPFPGYIQPAAILGWAGTGNYGVNVSGVGPFADNGVAPDQDYVAFIQGTSSSLATTMTALNPGDSYELSFAYNARQFDEAGPAQMTVLVDGGTVLQQAVNAIGGTNPYRTTNITFTATNASATVLFQQTAPGDQTLLLDDLRLVAVTRAVVRLNIAPAPPGAVRLSWPRTLGPAWGPQCAPRLPAAPGDWFDPGLPIWEEGDEYAVYDTSGTGTKFYRLFRP